MDDFDMDGFEQDLRQALERRPAPPSLKGKIVARRGSAKRGRAAMWQRLAASLALAAALGGGLAWRQREERRKGEAAREQVLTALRITEQALNRMNRQLAAHDGAQQ